MKSYDINAVSIIIGAHVVQGGADGAVVTVERNADTFSRMAGAGGEQVRTKSNDKSGRITLTLLQTSKSNDVLSAYTAAQDAGVGNSDIFPVLIKDNNSGGTICSGETAWVVKPPSVEFGKEVSNREWVIDVAELAMFVAGSDDV